MTMNLQLIVVGSTTRIPRKIISELERVRVIDALAVLYWETR